MRRAPLSCACVALAVAAGGFVIYATYAAQALEAELAALNDEIRAERETIRVLEAEWAHLTAPARLRRLADTHLMLAPAAPEQIRPAATLADLPRRDAIETPSPDAPVPVARRPAPAESGDSAPGAAEATPAATATAALAAQFPLPARPPTAIGAGPAAMQPAPADGGTPATATPADTPDNRGEDTLGALIAELDEAEDGS